jgi:hypothetical protein
MDSGLQDVALACVRQAVVVTKQLFWPGTFDPGSLAIDGIPTWRMPPTPNFACRALQVEGLVRVHRLAASN